ncbi:MAG TPA: MFS transporter [Longimicrobiales bacterium]|nr:MFS transporter [Longimicrobiales bacterium]
MSNGDTPGSGSKLRFALRALRHRNFRLFTAGQSISVIGTWMQQVAVSWLVYRLTGSAFYLGLVGFLGQAPAFVLAPFAGALADRVNKHRLVIATQTAAMVQATLLAVLVLSGTVEVWHILLLMTMLGAIIGFDTPSRQAFLLEMVGERADLPNAIALNSSMFNLARLIGPAIAGVAIAVMGEGWVIAINAASYIAVLSSLLLMRLTPVRRVRASVSVLSHIREGFDYAFGFAPIRSILLMVATVSVVAVPFTVLLPVIATDVLGGGADTLGFLMAAMGLGALSGALFLAARSTVAGLGRVIARAATLFGAALLGVAASRSLPLTLLALVFAGFGMMTQMASSNTVLQTLVDDDKRGRIMSLYSMAFLGMTPLGSLIAGVAASRIGAPLTIAVGGTCAILAAFLFRLRLPALREQVRPIYRRLGILPEVARGLQAATHSTTPDVGEEGPSGEAA